MVWAIAVSFKVFGYNAFALRFPSALFTILTLLLIFNLVRLFKENDFAFWTCIIIIAGRALIGDHGARTGDTDALHTLLLLAFAYHFILYIEFGKSNSLLWCGLLLGLDFYNKSFAAGFLVPGALLMVLLRGKLLSILKDWHLYASLLIFVAFIFSWYILVMNYGLEDSGGVMPGKNVWENMFVYDIYQRFFDPAFTANTGINFLFLFHFLDAKLLFLSPVFYLALLWGLIALIKNRQKLREFIFQENHRLELYAFVLVFSLAGILTFSQNKNSWYRQSHFSLLCDPDGLGHSSHSQTVRLDAMDMGRIDPGSFGRSSHNIKQGENRGCFLFCKARNRNQRRGFNPSDSKTPSLPYPEHSVFEPKYQKTLL